MHLETNFHIWTAIFAFGLTVIGVVDLLALIGIWIYSRYREIDSDLKDDLLYYVPVIALTCFVLAGVAYFLNLHL